MRKEEKKEEYVIVLDFLPGGDLGKNIKEPTIYGIGTKYFTLLLLTAKPGVKVNALEEIYIGEGHRDKVKSILRKLKYDELSLLAKENLKQAIQIIIKKREKEFVEFFNKAGPLNIKTHYLELLPGIGKTTLNRILEERDKKPFESFEDIKKRIKGLGDPLEILTERIIREITGKEHIKIFVNL